MSFTLDQTDHEIWHLALTCDTCMKHEKADIPFDSCISDKILGLGWKVHKELDAMQQKFKYYHFCCEEHKQEFIDTKKKVLDYYENRK